MRRWGELAAVVAVASLGGCAVLANYDFGSYKARTGSGGGGAAATGSGGNGIGGAATTGSLSSTGGGGNASTASVGSGGSGGGTVSDITLYEGSDAPTSIAIATGKVYFSTDDMSTNGTIRRADKDGTNKLTLLSGLTSPGTISVDGAFVYFSSYDAPDAVARVSTAGGSLDPLVNDPMFVGGAVASASFLFWSGTDAGQIVRGNLDGTMATVIVPSATAATLITADADGVYWLSVGTLMGNDSSVMRAGLDGQNPHAIATNQDFPTSIVSDSTRIYWGTIHGGIASRVKSETMATTVYQASDVSLLTITGIAAFGGMIYATEDTRIFSFPSAGGALAPIRTGVDGPRYIAVDSDSICYTTSSNMGQHDFVVRIPR